LVSGPFLELFVVLTGKNARQQQTDHNATPHDFNYSDPNTLRNRSIIWANA
jgi:hypothetical protein